MSAEQQALEALDREWAHVLHGLPPPPPAADHAAVVQKHRADGRVHELLEHYAKRLPAHLFVPRLLAAGQQLVQRKEHDLAAAACFQRLVALTNAQGAADGCRKLDAAGRLALHVQALFGLHSCQAESVLHADPQLRHQHSVDAVLAALAGLQLGLQAACEQALPSAPALVPAGTVHVHALARRLMAAGMHAQALPFLVSAARDMEGHISLNTAHLPCRTRLYSAAAQCFYAVSHSAMPPDAAGSTSKAHAFLAGGLQQLDELAQAQALDAVPAPDVTAAIRAAQARLVLLQTTLFPQQPPGQVAMSVQDVISAVGDERAQLTALVEVLQASLCMAASPLEQAVPSEQLQATLTAAAQLAGRVLSLGSAAAPQEGQAGGGAAGTGESSSGSIEACRRDKLHLVSGIACSVACSCWSHGCHWLLTGLFACTPQDLLCVAFSYQQQELLGQLLHAAPPPSAPAHGAAATAADSACLAAAACVLQAVFQLQQVPSAARVASILQLAAALDSHSATLAASLPSLVAATALRLHEAATLLLPGCFEAADAQLPGVLGVLRGTHAGLQHSGHSDGVLRACVAVQLALLLEQHGQPEQALAVAAQVTCSGC
jgi:hypothetical protein